MTLSPHSPHLHTPDALAILQAYSARAETQKAQGRSLSYSTVATHCLLPDGDITSIDEDDTLSSGLSVAAPLPPLRDRDLQVLASWFSVEQIEESMAEVYASLLQRFPEPCWEDNLLLLKGLL